MFKECKSNVRKLNIVVQNRAVKCFRILALSTKEENKTV